MLKNFVTIAFRNFLKQKRYHSINFIGLTVGMLSCALAFLYINHELSYDSFHHNPDNTYRVTAQAGYGPWFPTVGKNYGEVLFTGELPEIKKVVRFRRTPQKFITYQENKLNPSAIITDHGSQFFEIFDFAALEGDPSQMLQEPGAAVLTETMANSVLGAPPHLGKIIKWDTLTLQVTGVIQDLPSNTHLNFNLILTHREAINGAFHYVELTPGADPKILTQKILAMDVATNIYDTLLDARLQPLAAIHLDKPLTYEMKPPNDKGYLYLFGGIALFVLIISTTNYMNLSAAIYAGRNTEIALRKVFGSSKKALSLQFLLESTLLSLLTLPVVLLCLEAILPAFVNFLDIPLENIFITSLRYFVMLLGIATITGLVAGIYPVLTMTHFSPLKLLKESGSTASTGLKIRKVLLTLQFTILILLGTGAYFINQQLHYIQDKDLGIETERIVKITNVYSLEGNEAYNALKARFLQNPQISGFTTGIAPGSEDYGTRYIAEGHEERNDAMSFGTDFDYFDVMGVEIIAGDFFQKSADELPNVSLLVNERFVELMGWDDPIGKRVTLNPGDRQYDRFVAGVFKNYHSQSLHEEIAPQFIFVRKTRNYPSENLLVKISTGDIQASFDAIEEAWYDRLPNSPINYEFVNKDIQAAYEQEQKAGALSTYLSIIAISLSIMGLVGLTAYIGKLRTKEVGIRKVLGAPISEILILLNREFVLLVVLATVIASGISYYSVSAWLDTFVYRTSINVLVFGLAGVLVFLITVLTVSIQSAKTASRNPITALRHE